MSNAILIIGESGSGKSTAIRTLPPEQTFILNVIGKSLPFKGSKSSYHPLSADGLDGNYYSSDDPIQILRIIKLIHTKRLDIKYFIIDDFGYTITNNFMRKAMQKGFDKFSEIGLNTFHILDAVQNLREDLFCFVMMHTEIDSHGKYKPKTVGKMIDQYVVIEGKFTHVYHSLITDGQYRFLTNNDGQHMAKTPLGMHEDLFIENDLKLVSDKIQQYLEE
ncbi:MAG: ATP-binding protein [Candidatus Nitrosocosmicus sp.]